MSRSCGVVALVLVCAACGGSPPHRDVEREWVANAHGVIRQLRDDVLLVAGGDQAPVARRTLADDSELYGALVVYTDFGGCRHMVAALGAAPLRFERSARQLGRACDDLQRAATLFTRAVARSAPDVLVAAARSALHALPALDRAQLRLAVETRRRGV